ncbi:hypothetical protein FRC07_010955 [Ceratobasidium sp. 392]|nr:hypothetical protein FRC07_010955 [Ceratobasidium sp. 392]
MIVHMRGRHSSIWNAALQADATASGQAESGQTDAIAESTAIAAPGDSETPFDVDEFYRLLSRWIATGNQPFTEVENQEFQELLTYLKPDLQGHLPTSQAIQDRISSNLVDHA